VDAIEQIMLEEDRRGPLPDPKFPSGFTITWMPVAQATGYHVYRTTVCDDGSIRRHMARYRAGKKKLNKAKRQRRARTGRRK
jgi:hypothetical protein